MSFGVTLPPQTASEREAKRFAREKSYYGVCKTGGHLMKSGNIGSHEGRVYCLACVEDGTITLTSQRQVYFIADGAGHVKIGFAVNVGARLAELQTGNALPLTLLATCKGSCDVERSLHRRFAEHHVRGEWFRLAPEIVDHIAGLQAAASVSTVPA